MANLLFSAVYQPNLKEYRVCKDLPKADIDSKSHEFQYFSTDFFYFFSLTPSGSDDTTVSNEPPCVLDKLISSHDGIIVEVKTIREQYWKSHIKSFFDRQLLKGEPGKWSQQLDSGCAKLYGILETTNFEVNAKMIRR